MNKHNLIKLISIFSLITLMFSCSTPKKCSSCVKPPVQKTTVQKTTAQKTTPKKAVYGIAEPGVYALFKTSKGDIRVKLYYKKAPVTVANFIALSEGTKKSNKELGVPFYDGTKFHRVISDFMIQGGDPEGSGRGGPGYRFKDEFHADLKHDSAGILSMANSGPNTNGSQFFITHTETPWLNNKHSVFGKTLASSDQKVVDEIERGDTLIKIIIIRIGADAQSFSAK